MGRKGRSSQDSTYFKVLATFQCSNGECKKVWHSAHGWNKDEELENICKVCSTSGKLVDCKDEMVKLDTYNCTKSSCGGQWQALHIVQRKVQQCGDCGTLVAPETHPQERFARHYVFECKNKSCSNVSKRWEDFSTSPQKTQSCTKCHNKGEIKRIQQLKPIWLIRRQQQEKTAAGNQEKSDTSNVSNSPIAGPPIIGVGRGLSKHNSDFCDMCQSMIRQGYRSCHQYRKVVTKQEVSSTGALIEKIVDLKLK